MPSFEGKEFSGGRIYAVVTRADGTVEDYGLICSSKKSEQIYIKVRDFFRGIKKWSTQRFS
jgi:hypothetical protein